MSDHFAKASPDDKAMSKSSSQAGQPTWMSNWIRGNSKTKSAVDSSLLIRDKDRPVDSMSCPAPTRLKMDEWLSESSKEVSKDAQTMVIAKPNKNMTKILGDFQNEISSSSFPTLTLGQNTANTSTIRTQVDEEFGHKTMSLALALGREGTATNLNKLQEDNLRGKNGLSQLFEGQKGIAVPGTGTYKKTGSTPCLHPHVSNHADSSRPVVVLERQFSNDNFTCFGQENCKYQKFSFVVHESKMDNDLSQQNGLHLQHDQSANKNFHPLFGKKQSKSAQGHSPAGFLPTYRSLSDIDQGNLSHRSHVPDSLPCSVHNVETMRICTMVDSVEHSPGGPHKISQRAHHFLFTKETCVNLSKGHQVLREPTSSTHCEEKTSPRPFGVSPDVSSHSRGVKIQPLWTSTDSEEKGYTGDPSTCREGSRNEASNETDGKHIETPMNQNSILGMASSPLHKDDTVDESSSPAACDSSSEKTRSKRPLVEIPDINEELPGLQPAVSSTDGTEPGTSRVHSLNAKHLFACDEQTSRFECNARQDRSLGPDTSSRWIKRLKLNTSDSFGVGTKSSDTREGSYPEKNNIFFNRMMKGNRDSSDTKLDQYHGKGEMALDLLETGGSSVMVSRKRDHSTMNGCSWIQRWCQQSTPSPPKNSGPLVICEPHSLKLAQDELSKKQFPSIAALALMGKAMNGVRSCEFRKRGPVVVWNTKEF